jgi:Flp pilus assembly pilin Flp
MKRLVQFFASDESRGAAVEYCVIAAAIAVAIVMVLGQVGGQLDTAFNTVQADLKP